MVVSSTIFRLVLFSSMIGNLLADNPMCVVDGEEGYKMSETAYCGVKSGNELLRVRGETQVICTQTSPIKDCYNESPSVLCCSGDFCNYGITSTKCSEYSPPKTKCPTSTFSNGKVTSSVEMANCHPKDHPFCSAKRSLKASATEWEYECEDGEQCNDIKEGCKELPEEASKTGQDSVKLCCKPVAMGEKLSTKWGERVAAGESGLAADEKTSSSNRHTITIGLIFVVFKI